MIPETMCAMLLTGHGGPGKLVVVPDSKWQAMTA